MAERERGVELSVDKGMKARTDTSGRKTGGIIALIDQPDNSISICVIQMVFNFPQRYLHSSIYISFVRNCLAPAARPLLGPKPRFGFPPFFLSHLKTAVSRICMSLTSLLNCFRLVRLSNAPILNIYVIGLFGLFNVRRARLSLEYLIF